FFLSVFFLSIGLQIQLDFVINNFGAIMLITLCVLLINSLINTLIFRWMGSTWRDSVYSGALLSQIGEFSFVLVNMAVSIGLIVEYSYQITLAVIAMTMMLTMIWISVIQKFIYKLPDKLLVS
ncbi:MAG: cation:proton antiporter, partial [Cyclobacteriaceae bacterium]|nr:cation:proton antiporter [Cyclobacteriaceae bacterium]